MRLFMGRRPLTVGEMLAELGRGDAYLDRPQDAYGDGIVRELEDRVAALLGKPAAAYFPTGTMAQQIALRVWAERTGNPAVGLHPLGHIEAEERKAYAAVSGLRSIWPTTARRSPTAQEIRELAEPISSLVVELPLRRAGFLLPTFEELTELCAAARDRGFSVHFDGARLWDCTTWFDRDLPVVADLADSVYVSFYKSLAAFGGAALAGSAEFVAEAKAWRHRYGGQILIQWPHILSALIGLDQELPRLREYAAHARTVATVLAGLPGARVFPDPPHTQQFQLWLPHVAGDLEEAFLTMVEQDGLRFIGGWTEQPPGGVSMAEVSVGADATSWSAEEVHRAGELLLSRLPARSALE
ncbi:beta-eliminating lyase-related protein [Hamadaea sp. NPDC050747]|uniref:threonine aldolase family protein n=1 Tax=Hamadaea sp. NPDC050747 TaxID=3155789 RepID=UPI003409A5D7